MQASSRELFLPFILFLSISFLLLSRNVSERVRAWTHILSPAPTVRLKIGRGIDATKIHPHISDTLRHPWSLSLSLSHTHTHTHSLSLSLSPLPWHYIKGAVFYAGCLTIQPTLSLPPSLILTLWLTLSLSPTLTLSLSLAAFVYASFSESLFFLFFSTDAKFCPGLVELIACRKDLGTTLQDYNLAGLEKKMSAQF